MVRTRRGAIIRLSTSSRCLCSGVLHHLGLLCLLVLCEPGRWYDLGTAAYSWREVFSCNGTINTSDARLKKEIKEIEYGLDEILRLRPVTYQWKSSTDEGRQLGLIAQEVQPIIGEVVNVGDDPNQTMGINYTKLIPVLIKSAQELKAENDNLKAQLAHLTSLVETIQAQLNDNSNGNGELAVNK